MILGLLFGLSSLLVVATDDIVHDAKSRSAAQGMLLLAGLFGMPGAALFRWGRTIGDEEERLSKVASLVQAYRRLAIPDAARKLGWTEYEVERVFAECVTREIVKGHVDRSTQELFTLSSLGEEIAQAGHLCTHCGASLDRRFLTGETVVCPYCQSSISTKYPPST